MLKEGRTPGIQVFQKVVPGLHSLGITSLDRSGGGRGEGATAGEVERSDEGVPVGMVAFITKWLDKMAGTIRGRRVVVVREIGGRSRRVVCKTDRKTVVEIFFCSIFRNRLKQVLSFQNKI